MRKRIDFWLDENRPADLKVWKVVQKLRSKRIFAQTVKDGILVIEQLRRGKLDHLLRLHPWIVDKILATYAPKPETPPSAPSGGDLEQIIQSSVQASVQQAFMNMPSLPATTPVAAPLKQSGTLKQVTFTAAPAEDEDDGDTLIITNAKKGSASENLKAQMLGMSADEGVDRLYEERLAAGLIDPRTGRLREQAERSIALD